MRTIILIVICVGVGYFLALQQHNTQVSRIISYFGTENVGMSKKPEVTDSDDLTEVVQIQKAKKRGKIEVVGGTEYDFGLMMKGSRRSHKFIFRNVGDADALVTFKTSSCKCTVGKFTNATVPPEGETEVELEWKAEADFDEFRQTATIETDCPDQDEIKLVIKGQIGETFVIDPPPFSYGDFFSNEETTILFTVYSFEEGQIKLSSGSVQDAVLSKKVKVFIAEERDLTNGEIPHMADAKHAVDCRLVIDKGMTAGPVNFVIKLARQVDGVYDLQNEFINYNIRANCITPVRVIAGNDYNENRNIYNMGSGRSKDGIKKQFLIAIKNEGDDHNPNVRIEKTIPECVHATVEEAQVTPAQRIYRISLQVPPGTDPVELDGTFSKDFGKVVIETDMETAPRIPIYLKFRIIE